MKLHIISNSHVDPVWLWDKYEGIDEVLATFRAVCDRLDEYPQLTFCASSIQFYDWVLQYDPVLFERIRSFVNQGRWEIVGGWWVESDTNLPSKSSLLDQARVARRFLAAHFFRESSVAYLPDSFGHPASLPQILIESGFKYFLFCRPGPHENDAIPANLFYWSWKGCRVLAYRLKHMYTQNSGVPPRVIDSPRFQSMLSDQEYNDSSIHCFLFGVGDHGGGPSIKEIEYFNDYINASDGKAGYSTCQHFFEKAEHLDGIPEYTGDLHYHAVGCYSVLRNLKLAMRTAEQSIASASRALAMAGESDEVLVSLRQTLAFNQFHDILPGSCSETAAEQAESELRAINAECRDTLYSTLKQISAAAPVSNPEGEFRVFNTLPFAVTVPLSIESFPYFRTRVPFRNSDGNPVNIQEVMPHVRCRYHRWEFVDTLPPRGFVSYTFAGNGENVNVLPDTAHFIPGTIIETTDCHITSKSLTDIVFKTGQTIPATLQFLVLSDTSDTWGHGISSFDSVAGHFKLESTSICTGPVTSKLYQTFCYNNSRVETIYSLYPALPYSYLDIAVFWTEHQAILKLEINPESPAADTITMQIPGDCIDRPADGAELPVHSWIWIPVGNQGIAVIQDGAFAADCKNGKLRLTLVRSNLYGYDSPMMIKPHDPQLHTDQGTHRFRLCIFRHDCFESDVFNRLSAAFLEPFPVVRET